MKTLKIILLFGVIFFWTITWHLSKNLFSEGHLQIATAVLVGLFFVFGLLSFIVLLRFKYFLNKEINSHQYPKKNKLLWKYIWTIIVVIIISKISIWGINETLNPTTIDKNEIIEIKGTIKETPKYTKGAKAGSGDIDFKINEFPEIQFDLPYPDYFHFETSIEYDFAINDSIFFSISKENYSGYIAKEKEFTFSQKHINHNIVEVITVRSKNDSYLTLNGHNQLNIEDSKYAIIFVIVVVLFGLLIFQLIWKKEIYEYLDKKGLHKTKSFLEKINKKR